MVEKIKKVSNPLTIIAIFAGLAEISGTVVLPLVAKEVQCVFVWFLMFFPLALVGAFFWTLNRNHKVLYAPSDFHDDESFFRAATATERGLTLVKDVLDVRPVKTVKQWGSSTIAATDHPEMLMDVDEALAKKVQRASESRVYVLTELRKEFPGEYEFQVVLQEPDGIITFDAIFRRRPTLIGIDIVYVTKPDLDALFFDRLKEKTDALAKYTKHSMVFEKWEFLLVLVMDFPTADQEAYSQSVKHMMRFRSLPVQIRTFSFDNLAGKYEQRTEG